MNIDKNYYRNLSISSPTGYSNASWVNVNRASGQKVWRAVCIHKLTGQENDRNHHVYVDLLNESGDFLVNPLDRLAYAWNGQRQDEKSPPIRLDKPAHEPSGNVPVFKGAEFEVWIDSPYPSDRVSNLTTDLPDEDVGNVRYHHSYYIIFKLVDTVQVIKPSQPAIPTANSSANIDDIISTLNGLRDTIDHYLDELRSLREV